MPLTTQEFDYVRNLVMQDAAIVLEAGKEYLVESRLTPLATRLGHDSIGTLIARLRSEPLNGAHKMVVDAMTTNETSFFRDIHPFEALKRQIIPELISKRTPTRALRLWSAASSTGQEAYTVAMLLKENFPALSGWNVEILGTDISREVLERARSGIYSQMEMNRGMPAMLLVKNFTKINADHWQVKEELRQKIQFKEMNLARPFPPLPAFDIIFLRNVLIYFDLPTKRSILQKMRRQLAPGGYLFLGGAETTLNIDDSWQSVTCGKSVCYQLKN